ncbi:MAG: hypothetical protein U0Y08_09890 [Bacteroidia bacterium]
MTRTYLILFFLLLLVSACRQKNKLYSYNFDDIDLYNDHATIVKKQLAHSGEKCVLLTRENKYGPTFSGKIEEFGSGNISSIKVSAWVRSYSKASRVQIVCSIDRGDSTVYRETIDNSTVVSNSGEWKKIEGEFDISRFNDPQNKLNIYPFFAGEEDVNLDDLEFSFE